MVPTVQNSMKPFQVCIGYLSFACWLKSGNSIKVDVMDRYLSVIVRYLSVMDADQFLCFAFANFKVKCSASTFMAFSFSLTGHGLLQDGGASAEACSESRDGNR